MSSSSRLQEIRQSITTVSEQVINYILGAVRRIFSPSDDNYPTIGVQPFTGDPAEKRDD